MIDLGTHVLADGLTASDLQLAIDRAAATVGGVFQRRVLMAPGRWIIDKTVTLHGNVSLFGSGESATILQWKPGGKPGECIPKEGPALRVEENWNYEAGSFALENGATSAPGDKPITGIHLTAKPIQVSPQIGTKGGGATWRHIGLNDFDRGLVIGTDDKRANSELVFSNCKFKRNNKGVLIQDLNSKNIRFEMPSFESNEWGIHAAQGGTVSIQGGAGTDNGYDFAIGPGGTFSARDYRSELPRIAAFWASGVFGCTTVVLSACEVHTEATNTDPTTGNTVYLQGGAMFTIIGGIYDRPPVVALHTPDENGLPGLQQITMIGCGIRPFPLDSATDTSFSIARLEQIRNLPSYPQMKDHLRYVQLGVMRLNTRRAGIGRYPDVLNGVLP